MSNHSKDEAFHKCLAQEHNKRTCHLDLHTMSSMLNVKLESCEYQLFKYFGLTWPGIKIRSIEYKEDTVTLDQSLVNFLTSSTMCFEIDYYYN